jgi:hypothetical protein
LSFCYAAIAVIIAQPALYDGAAIIMYLDDEDVSVAGNRLSHNHFLNDVKLNLKGIKNLYFNIFCGLIVKK